MIKQLQTFTVSVGEVAGNCKRLSVRRKTVSSSGTASSANKLAENFYKSTCLIELTIAYVCGIKTLHLFGCRWISLTLGKVEIK